MRRPQCDQQPICSIGLFRATGGLRGRRDVIFRMVSVDGHSPGQQRDPVLVGQCCRYLPNPVFLQWHQQLARFFGESRHRICGVVLPTRARGVEFFHLRDPIQQLGRDERDPYVLFERCVHEFGDRDGHHMAQSGKSIHEQLVGLRSRRRGRRRIGLLQWVHGRFPGVYACAHAARCAGLVDVWVQQHKSGVSGHVGDGGSTHRPVGSANLLPLQSGHDIDSVWPQCVGFVGIFRSIYWIEFRRNDGEFYRTQYLLLCIGGTKHECGCRSFVKIAHGCGEL